MTNKAFFRYGMRFAFMKTFTYTMPGKLKKQFYRNEAGHEESRQVPLRIKCEEYQGKKVGTPMIWGRYPSGRPLAVAVIITQHEKEKQ
jgi:hypothetical protein